MVTTRKKRVAMTEKLKKDVFTACVVRVSREILPYGSFKAVGETHKIHPRTVANLWYSTLKQIPGYQPNTPLDPVSLLANVPETAFTTKFENSGRNPKHDRDMLLQEIKNIDPTARRTIRSLAGAVGIPVMTIWRMKQSKKLKVHTMALKPKLNDDHRLNRLFHCIAKNDKNTINSVAEMTFKSMYNEIHIDEKWFFLVRDGLRCIVTQDEPPPKAISVSHKSHITKVMFLSALARPRFNHTTRQEFDGLIGIYPVGEIDMYVRASHGHQPGDLKWCNVNMDRDLYRDMLFNFVLPDVKKKMPIDNNIILQQDGAKAHLPDDDPLFAAKVTELFGDPTAVKLYTQPAQSPDLNVNDLGFFNSLQSRYYQTAPKDALELIEMVEETYKNYPAKKLNRIWLTLQSVMNQVINQRGDNDYTIPHMKKSSGTTKPIATIVGCNCRGKHVSTRHLG
ncbi:hypothetical protein IV203_035373 [Nitzschia inconspicua]|uniref:Transposase n=2 Tax=Nitzschia inconspicua TaxID=303405 RepID=A0A9K3K4T7_9STRA|nr:hypothetical protein IV203_022774 [Nitzschia inconspicua]KAG7360274.1 hypothetical protein IV203_035373 [Nitzschia inconspicua]